MSSKLKGRCSRKLTAAIVSVLVLRQVAIENTEASEPRLIFSVSVSRLFFNPTLGQKVAISFSVSRAGLLTLSLFDARGGLVRRLASREAAEQGWRFYVWDG